MSALGTTPDLSPDDVPRAAIESCRFLHVNGRHWSVCLHAVRVARAANVKVSFDGGAQRYRPELRELVPRVVDTTGCGDSYHGAFLFGLLRGMDRAKTAVFASAVAALNSQRLGGRGGAADGGAGERVYGFFLTR